MSEMIFTRDHVWLLPSDNQEYLLGITDYAQEQLGDLVFVDLPDVGAVTREGEACLVVESVKSASDVICPLQGEISAINSNLESEPELINESAYDQGWIIRIKPDQDSKIQGKMNAHEYNAYVSGNAT